MKSESNENREESMVTPSTLATNLIQQMVNNYRDNQMVFIKENMGIDDAHSIWFDLKLLKNFISEIESEAQKVDPGVKDADLGIRFYYAAYPESPEEPIPSNYSQKHTLVMIPTKKQEGMNYDFNPFEEKEETEGRALALRPVMALAQNHGSLVPPGASIVESY